MAEPLDILFGHIFHCTWMTRKTKYINISVTWLKDLAKKTEEWPFFSGLQLKCRNSQQLSAPYVPTTSEFLITPLDLVQGTVIWGCFSRRKWRHLNKICIQYPIINFMFETNHGIGAIIHHFFWSNIFYTS